MKRESSLFASAILKTIVIAVVTYFLLQLFVGQEKEDKHILANKTFVSSDTWKQEWVQIELDDETKELVETALSDYHQSANINNPITAMYTSTCKKYKSICDITTFEAKNLTIKQKLYYQVMVIYAIGKLQWFGVSLLDYVDNITIQSESLKSRGYSSRNQIFLDVRAMQGYTEFLQVFIHELGHITDFRYLEWDPNNPKSKLYTEFGKSIFPLDDPSLDYYALNRLDEQTRTNTTSYKDFVSGYGMSDMFEDFAETYNFYINYNQIFQKLATQSETLRKKYDFVDQLFNWKFINAGVAKTSYFEEYDWDVRPYDTTRF